jgi:hypothetical protein
VCPGAEREDYSGDMLKDLRGVCDLLYLILQSGSIALVKDELEVCGTELEESLLRLLNVALEVSRLPIKKAVLLLSTYICSGLVGLSLKVR